MDAITLLKDDHKTVEALFTRFEKAGDRAYAEKRRIVDRIIEELSAHAAVEEQLFYPVARATVPGTEAVTLESLEEHHIVKWVLSELDSMAPEDERFDAKVAVLIENVRHHVEEEEQELFPKVREELGRNALSDLGEAMQKAKAIAPTHPHPRSPDTPPGNLLIGPAAGVVDRIGDTASGLAQGGVSAVSDLIATILRREKPRTRPTGSKAARDAAAKVRNGAADTADAIIEAAQDAKATGRRTARAARRGAARTGRAATSGAKGTATTARKSGATAASAAKRTATTAKRSAGSTTRSAKGTATSARKAAARTTTTAKRGATTTGRTARKAVKSTTAAARRG